MRVLLGSLLPLFIFEQSYSFKILLNYTNKEKKDKYAQ